VHSFEGEIWVGGGFGGADTPPAGVKVMTLKWVRFTDHGRHCNIASPIEEKVLCPCGALINDPHGECPK
jgi:hypothetical protein